MRGTMTKKELEALAAAISMTILSFAEPESKPEVKTAAKKVKAKAKPKVNAKPKTTPKKTKPVANPVESELILEDIDDDEPIPVRNNYISPSKRKNAIDVGDRTLARRQSFQAPKGPNKFVDNGMLCADDKIDPKKYPQPTDRREPARKETFTCDVCRRDFEAYPTEIPQAYIRLGDGRDAQRPEIRCDNCIAGSRR